MNIFSIQTNLVFLEKPEWLDAFKQKHNDIPYEYHVTLKQPCKITEEGIKDVREKLNVFFQNANKKSIPITFNQLVLDNSEVDKNEGVIMIKAKNDEIVELQKEILNLLSDYRDYYLPETEEYEKNFAPHITIAANLSREKFDLAKADLKGDYLLKGVITKVVLSVRNFDSATNNQDKREDYTYELSFTRIT